MLDRPRAVFAGSLLFACLACGISGPKKITTENGTFDVPGAGQTRPGGIVFSTMENGCEIPGGATQLTLTDVRTKKVDGVQRTLFHIQRTTCPGGWIDARHVYPTVAEKK